MSYDLWQCRKVCRFALIHIWKSAKSICQNVVRVLPTRCGSTVSQILQFFFWNYNKIENADYIIYVIKFIKYSMTDRTIPVKNYYFSSKDIQYSNEVLHTFIYKALVLIFIRYLYEMKWNEIKHLLNMYM